VIVDNDRGKLVTYLQPRSRLAWFCAFMRT